MNFNFNLEVKDGKINFNSDTISPIKLALLVAYVIIILPLMGLWGGAWATQIIDLSSSPEGLNKAVLLTTGLVAVFITSIVMAILAFTKRWEFFDMGLTRMVTVVFAVAAIALMGGAITVAPVTVLISILGVALFSLLTAAIVFVVLAMLE